MTFLVATNVVASRPPKRQPTGTPTARVKKNILWGTLYVYKRRLGLVLARLTHNI